MSEKISLDSSESITFYIIAGNLFLWDSQKGAHANNQLVTIICYYFIRTIEEKELDNISKKMW